MFGRQVVREEDDLHGPHDTDTSALSQPQHSQPTRTGTRHSHLALSYTHHRGGHRREAPPAEEPPQPQREARHELEQRVNVQPTLCAHQLAPHAVRVELFHAVLREDGKERGLVEERERKEAALARPAVRLARCLGWWGHRCLSVRCQKMHEPNHFLMLGWSLEVEVALFYVVGLVPGNH